MVDTEHLAVALSDLIATASSERELEDYQIILSSAVGSLGAPSSEPTETRREALEVIVRTLRRLVPKPVLWRGRLPFLTDDLLDALRREARAGHCRAIGASGHAFGCGGEVADKLAVAPELTQFMSSLAPGCTTTGIASYVYYGKEGDGIPLHLDTGMFALNVLIVLEHRHVGASSRLLMHTFGAEPERLRLGEGEVVVFDGSSIVHGREPLGPDETVSLLTLGFRPAPTTWES